MRSKTGNIAMIVIVLLVVAVALGMFGLRFGFDRGGVDGPITDPGPSKPFPLKEHPSTTQSSESPEKKVKIKVSKSYGLPDGSQEMEIAKVVQYLKEQPPGTIVVIGTGKATAGRGAEIREALRTAEIKFLEEE